MRRFLYNYQTIVRFDRPVTCHSFRLRCMPCANDFQQVVRKDLFVSPADYLSHDEDAWGNPVQYGSKFDAHDSFVFVSSGEVCQTAYRIPRNRVPYIYKVCAGLTAVSPGMAAFAMRFAADGTPVGQAMALCHALYGYMAYSPGSTHAATTAAQAFGQQAGVCQDYAHILVALCRARGMAARYVDGFLPGEGETHAWVEVFDGTAWVGIDPTHDRRIEYGYIKVAHGRDAADCPVCRGVFTGNMAGQQREIRVIVEEI